MVISFKVRRKFTFLCAISVLSAHFITAVNADYKVGVGIADITGPVAEVVFMGYAKSSQRGEGLHLRQFARAFIIEDGHERITFVNIDSCMIGHGVRKQVLERLNKRYNDTFNEQNFILSATHTHSAPGGFMMDFLFDISTMGFVKETFTALVSGIIKAVSRAHKSMQSAKIYINSGEVQDVNINRSPAAYLENPAAERSRYKYDVDKELTQMKFVTPKNKLLGVIQWFPVHATSMNNTNTLVSSDNVGYASILLEQHLNQGHLIGKGPVVAAFASSNLGDVSPNIRGPHCLNTGEPCDNVSSTCDGEAKLCVASGPGKDMFDSTRIIAEKLYKKALELLENENGQEVSGPLRVGLRYVDMPSQTAEYQLENGTTVTVHGCVPAMGYSFAAGTTDGPGEFDFKQATRSSNMLWNIVRDLLAPPTNEDISCHHPKPILLATGRIEYPQEWQPRIVSVQVAMIGNVVIAAVPGECTTMSGRRVRDAITAAVEESGGPSEVKVIIAGLSNIYSDYIVTPEEYQLQRYEAASTIFGPHTLTLYLKSFSDLAKSLIKGTPIDVGPVPPNLSTNLISLIPPVIFDNAGWNVDFGDCIKQPSTTVRIGETVTAQFIAGHPRNNVMHDRTFLLVEKLIGRDDWETIATDANWETKFKWERTQFFTGQSVATVEWTISEDASPGTYRIRHFGNYKYIWGGINSYEGLTNNFRVI